MRIVLKGIHSVTAKGNTYHYAWRGGPRLKGTPGTPEFVASYNEAVAERHAPDTSRFRGVVTAYKGSHDWQKLAPTTQKSWGPWLDKISDHFGDLRVAQFDRPQKIQPVIRKWRYQWAKTPRAADMGMQVLSRLCAFAIDPLGKIGSNPCEGVKRLYDGGERADIIWTDSDIAAVRKEASEELAFAIDLAVHTGLRRADLIRVSWGHVREHAIVLPTSKSRGRLEIVMPLYPALRELLDRIPKRATTILAHSRNRPWSGSGLGNAIDRAKTKAGISGLHLHDLRGTAATKFYVAGIEERAIAEMLGWDEESVKRIIRKYVSRNAATAAVIRKLEGDGATNQEQSL